ncbi:alpha/beta fold hydrolase [Microvirga lenta]|uniref:alpha/beta fold hydrolase n=1 Tax=Microvirga lenta TaxID=2881337 RepID=UPI001CFCCF42|nr:alpha/beta fold hydrolase [Microvirga lenta]MCB5174400.1 alpha/beta fold hydrolase [Microvirga lenta]
MAQATQKLNIPGWSGSASTSQRKVNGVLLHYVEAGAADAPLVILLHGFPDFWWGWRLQIGPLADAGLRVVAPDQRGYNLSGKPLGVRAYDLDILAADIVALADSLGASRFRLVGHDFGGIVAWQIAMRHPERVERLVVINAPHPDVFGSYLLRHPTQVMRSLYAGFFQLPLMPEATLSAGNYALLRQSLVASSQKNVFSSADLDRYERAWAEPGALTAMLNWYRALPRRPGRRDARVSVPTTVIWGLRDRFLEKGLADESLARCDDGQFIGFDRASHWVHLEEAAAVNAALAASLKPEARQPSAPSPGV